MVGIIEAFTQLAPIVSFFVLLVILVIQFYLMAELSTVLGPVMKILKRVNAVFEALYTPEGVEQIEGASALTQHLQDALKQVETGRQKARAAITNKPEATTSKSEAK